MPRSIPRVRAWAAATVILAVLAVVAVAGCGGGGATAGGTPGGTGPDGWAGVRARAEGQTVRWWMYGGDARINAYVEEHVVPAAARQGVTLERVPIDDTASAVQRVLAERDAGRDTGGAVDLIWINGENFALGKEAGLWRRDWAGELPNAALLAPGVDRDFGVPVEGQESPWSRASLVFAADSTRVPDPPRTVAGLLAYARAHPGRVTYPAPPDFTGSAFVRLLVQGLGEDEAFAALSDLRPLMYKGGSSLPASEAELTRLLGDGQVDIAMSYDPGFVASGVRTGTFPDTVRPFALDRTLTNTSFVTIPSNAAHADGALVVADLLLSPELQAAKADPGILGVPTVLDLARLTPAERRLFARLRPGPYLLAEGELGEPLAELPAAEVTRLDERWRREVTR